MESKLVRAVKSYKKSFHNYIRSQRNMRENTRESTRLLLSWGRGLGHRA